MTIIALHEEEYWPVYEPTDGDHYTVLTVDLPPLTIRRYLTALELFKMERDEFAAAVDAARRGKE